MRHRVAGRKLGRTASHRLATRRAVVVSLLRHEAITTGPALAKEVRALAERMITLGKKGGFANYRHALAELGDKAVVKKLFNDIGPRYASRDGGYTRILRLAERRKADGAERVIFELVGAEERRSQRLAASKKPKVAAEEKPKAGKAEAGAAKPAPEPAPEPAAESAPDKTQEGETTAPPAQGA